MTQVLLQSPAEIGDVDVALAADEHQGAVGAKVAVPGFDVLVGPRRVVKCEVLVRELRQVCPQADVGFVERFVAGEMFVVHDLTLIAAERAVNFVGRADVFRPGAVATVANATAGNRMVLSTRLLMQVVA